MDTIEIIEFEPHPCGEVILDLRKQRVRHCTGCWNCWLKTPGACAQHDIDAFYKALVHAKQAIFYITIQHDFLSSNMKNLLDRMIVFALPYISFQNNESRHVPRYPSLCSMTFYYQDHFSSKEAEHQFVEYVETIMHQFHIKNAVVLPYQEVVK